MLLSVLHPRDRLNPRLDSQVNFLLKLKHFRAFRNEPIGSASKYLANIIRILGRTEDQDGSRGMSVRPGAPKHFAAAYLRKTQVKKNQVRSRMAEHIESGFSIVRYCDIQRDG